jgi:hypothetical protein
MAFVYEVVPEKDKEFWVSLGIKNCWGIDLLRFATGSVWCADRERNAYLIGVGGGMHDVPLMSDLWWNGNVIRIEWDDNQNTGNRRLPKGLSVVWNIHKIFIPPSIMDQKDTVVKMVEEAFSVDCDGAKKENVLSISVIMDNTIILTKEDI